MLPFLLGVYSVAGMRVISTYTGAGGLDVGFHQAGAKAIAACELDLSACKTYEANFKDVRLYKGRVSDALDDGFFDNLDGDVLIGGPPCQGFSVAGKMDPEDPRSLEIFNFLRVLERTQPRAFVMENVKALATLTKWEFVRERVVRQSMRAGYTVKMLVLNSADFGVPQRRERVFFVGFHADGGGSRAAAAMASFLETLITEEAEPPTIGSIVRNLGPAGSQGNARVCNAKVNFATNPIMRRSPYAGMLFNGAGRPLDANGISSTLPASMGGNKTPIVDEVQIFDGGDSFVEKYHSRLQAGGGSMHGQAPARLRRLTVDECIAIQTFPADYTFEGSKSSVFKQIGNAVAPKMARAIATALRAGLEELCATPRVPKSRPSTA